MPAAQKIPRLCRCRKVEESDAVTEALEEGEAVPLEPL